MIPKYFAEVTLRIGWSIIIYVIDKHHKGCFLFIMVRCSHLSKLRGISQVAAQPTSLFKSLCNIMASSLDSIALYRIISSAYKRILDEMDAVRSLIKTHGSESRGQERAKQIAKNKTRDELLCVFYTSERFRNMTS